MSIGSLTHHYFRPGSVAPLNPPRPGIVLRPDLSLALWQGAPVALTVTEMKMIALLLQRRGGDVSYRTLYDLVHGQGFVAGKGASGFRANVRAFIKRMRQKFRAIDPAFDAIANRAGVGYFWQGGGLD